MNSYGNEHKLRICALKQDAQKIFRYLMLHFLFFCLHEVARFPRTRTIQETING